MVKAVFSSVFGLAFGFGLMFVGLLASAAFAAPPNVNCNSQGAAALQIAIDTGSEGDVIEVADAGRERGSRRSG